MLRCIRRQTCAYECIWGCAKLSESLYRAGRLARTSSHFGLECMRERTDALDRAVAGVNTDPVDAVLRARRFV